MPSVSSNTSESSESSEPTSPKVTMPHTEAILDLTNHLGKVYKGLSEVMQLQVSDRTKFSDIISKITLGMEQISKRLLSIEARLTEAKSQSTHRTLETDHSNIRSTLPTRFTLAEFNSRYADNADTQATMRTLEVLTQKDNEGFTDYFNRWKKISGQIATQPNETEMVDKFITSLRPIYQCNMRYANISNFGQLIALGRRLEDDMQSETLAKLRRNGSQDNTSRRDNPNNSSILNMLSIQTQKSPDLVKKDREFTPIPLTYTEAFKRFNEMQLLQPIGPTMDPPASDRSKKWDANQYCLYHRGNGHDTENCFRLKHKIQDLIDSEERFLHQDKKRRLG